MARRVPRASQGDRIGNGNLILQRIKSKYLAAAKAAVAAIEAGITSAPSTTCAIDGMPRAAWYPACMRYGVSLTGILASAR